ncbi:MAG TPA: flagellin [Rhizomicrobium sp.]|jgi:flagellar hook-associated protein 3 FlgL|nr:flagellin [Rhizomicrobium sp.]
MIDRVASNSQSQFMLSQIMNAENALNTSEQQVASGKVADTYSGIGDKTAVLEAARSAANKSSALQSTLQLAVNQTNLQDTQVTQLSSLADQLRQDVTTALSNNDASTLMSQAQGIFDQAQQILNAQDANGNYLYGGDKDTTPPVTVNSLSDLASLGSVSQAFANGSTAKSVNTGDGQTVQVGLLASDLGTQLFSSLQQIAQFNAGANGNFGQGVSQAQSTFLTTQVNNAKTASTNLNTAAAQNGDVYNQLNDAVTQQQSLNTLYTGFVSNLEDVNMAQAATQLSQNQTALQAALQVTAQLSQVSLLNYLPATTTG